MSFNFDPSDDLGLVADGVETVTLLRRGSTIDTAGETIVRAVRRSMSAAEATILASGDVHKTVAGDGLHTAFAVVWHLPCTELAAAPRLGDVLLDADGQRWTILGVKHATLGARWRCETRNVAIAYGLDDTISILKAVTSVKWRIWLTGIRARIQPLRTVVTTSDDIATTTHTYRIFIEENLMLSHTCRIRGPNGALYAILSSTGAERIGELQTIEAKLLGA